MKKKSNSAPSDPFKQTLDGLFMAFGFKEPTPENFTHRATAAFKHPLSELAMLWAEPQGTLKQRVMDGLSRPATGKLLTMLLTHKARDGYQAVAKHLGFCREITADSVAYRAETGKLAGYRVICNGASTGCTLFHSNMAISGDCLDYVYAIELNTFLRDDFIPLFAHLELEAKQTARAEMAFIADELEEASLPLEADAELNAQTLGKAARALRDKSNSAPRTLIVGSDHELQAQTLGEQFKLDVICDSVSIPSSRWFLLSDAARIELVRKPNAISPFQVSAFHAARGDTYHLFAESVVAVRLDGVERHTIRGGVAPSPAELMRQINAAVTRIQVTQAATDAAIKTTTDIVSGVIKAAGSNVTKTGEA